jgi:hypothetical protein
MKYENSSWKPGKSRVPRGYRRNGSKPEILKRKKHQIYPGERSPDMLMLDLFFSPFKMVRICQENVHVGLSYR